jgi:hypothetical protein
MVIILGFLSSACEEVIQLDLPTETPRLAIDASLQMTPNESLPQVVKLSLSGSFYQEQNPVVSDAIVQLIDLTNKILKQILLQVSILTINYASYIIMKHMSQQ